MKIAIVFAVLLTSGWAGAQTMYKCEANGKIEYSDKPCLTGIEVKRIARDGGPTAEDRGRATMRLRSEQERFDAQEQADYRERTARRAAPAESPSAPTAKDPRNEKILTHDISGWDRKPRGQVEAEQRAKNIGRAAADQGSTAPVITEAHSVDPNAWQNEKTMVHVRSGWTQKTRGAVVQEHADKAYYQAKQPNVATCTPGGCSGTDGNFYAGGPILYQSPEGHLCTRSGSVLNCD